MPKASFPGSGSKGVEGGRRGQPDVSPWRFVAGQLSRRYWLAPMCGRSSVVYFQGVSAVAGRQNWRRSQSAPTGSRGDEEVGSPAPASTFVPRRVRLATGLLRGLAGRPRTGSLLALPASFLGALQGTLEKIGSGVFFKRPHYPPSVLFTRTKTRGFALPWSRSVVLLDGRRQSRCRTQKAR
jgi:hypothetical protein